MPPQRKCNTTKKTGPIVVCVSGRDTGCSMMIDAEYVKSLNMNVIPVLPEPARSTIDSCTR